MLLNVCFFKPSGNVSVTFRGSSPKKFPMSPCQMLVTLRVNGEVLLKKFADMKQLHRFLFQWSDDEILPHYVIVGFVKQPKYHN